jgi:hypothetical protein
MALSDLVLFVVFVAIFVATAVITLLGIIERVRVQPRYLNALFTALILEVVGAVVVLFRQQLVHGDTAARAEVDSGYVAVAARPEPPGGDGGADPAQGRIGRPDDGCPKACPAADAATQDELARVSRERAQLLEALGAATPEAGVAAAGTLADLRRRVPAADDAALSDAVAQQAAFFADLRKQYGCTDVADCAGKANECLAAESGDDLMRQVLHLADELIRTHGGRYADVRYYSSVAKRKEHEPVFRLIDEILDAVPADASEPTEAAVAAGGGAPPDVRAPAPDPQPSPAALRTETHVDYGNQEVVEALAARLAAFKKARGLRRPDYRIDWAVVAALIQVAGGG